MRIGQVAHHGRQIPGGCQRHAAQRKILLDARRNARDPHRASCRSFTRCLTEKMMTYALGRGLQPYDAAPSNEIDTNVAASGYQFQSLIHEIVHSLPFQIAARRSGPRNQQIAAKPEGDSSTDDHSQISSQTNLPARHRHADRPSVSRCHGAGARRQHDPGKPPVRMAFVYVPNGIIMPAGTPTTKASYANCRAP